MNNNTLEFFVKMKDLMSGGLAKLATNAKETFVKVETAMSNVVTKNKQVATSFEGVTGKVNKLKETASSGMGFVDRLIERMAVYASVYGAINAVGNAMDKAHAMHEAEAALANTMQNKGASGEQIETAIKNAEMLSKNILFTKAQVIDLESQLRLVGNISEKEMGRMAKDSADMATKFHMSLDEAGNTLAKAVNNPEMLRRLGMQLKIDPAIQEHLQNLAKHGKEAQARLELLTIVERQVGGAAQAAFNADPLAKFHKTIEDIQVRVGNFAILLETKLAIAFNDVTEAVKSAITWMEQHKTLMEVIGGVVGVITVAILAQYTVIGLVATATKLWAAAQWVLNSSMLANPLTWIIALIIAVVAAISYVVYATKGWGKQWDDIVGFAKAVWAAFKDNFMLIWLAVQNAFMTGIELIEKGWYHLESLWDKDAAASGLSKINDEQNKRAEAIAKQRGLLMSDVKDAESHLKWDLSWDSSKSVSGLIGDMKKKLGLSGMAANLPGGGSSTGGGNYGGTSSSDIGRAAASGGPRVININGVKFADKIEIHGENMHDAYGKTQAVLEEMFLRTLNSGASVQ